jgi:hypothetical protein
VISLLAEAWPSMNHSVPDFHPRLWTENEKNRPGDAQTGLQALIDFGQPKQ